MHSSISLNLEPDLGRGVPGGHDLYTFVTSAAGHMMRTLQKPRKSRPSKRQVNHRRFLHNMIQRKFADIEAANHRLASVLYFKGDEKKPDTHDPSLNPSEINPATPKTTTNEETLQKTNISETIDSQSPEIGRKTQPKPAKEPRPKSTKSKHQKSDRKHLERASMEFMPPETIHFDDDGIMMDAFFTMDAQTESSHFQLDLDTLSPSFSPELSPLSIDSWDFPDFSSCSPTHCDSVEEIVESQWAEIIDLFSDRRGSADVEDYLESLCDCQSDAECGKDDEQEDFVYERAQCRYETSHVLTANHLEHIAPLFTSDNGLDMSNFPSSNNNDILQIQLPNSMSYQCMSYQHPSQQNQCTGRYELTPIPFEGVAQSFSAPSQNIPPHFSIPTPPYEGDWLFTDILTDNPTSLYEKKDCATYLVK